MKLEYTNKFLLLFSFSIVSILFLGCRKDAFTGFINPEIQPYVDEFIAQAKIRGIEIDETELEAFLVNEFSVDLGPEICGLGSYDLVQGGRQIQLLNNGRCWHDRSDIEKENLVFHELGHAFLNRRHLSKAFPNGIATSLMCSRLESEIACQSFTIYYENTDLRKYYLDELFDSTTPKPEYATQNNFVKTVFDDGSQPYYTDWELTIFGDDENTSNFRFTQDTSNMGGATTLTFSTDGAPELPAASASISKRFEISDFMQCDNLKAFAKIQSEGITDGAFWSGISLGEKITQDSLNRFHIERKREDRNEIFPQFTQEMYCIDKRTDIVTISFLMRSSTPASITIDDLHIDLFN